MQCSRPAVCVKDSLYPLRKELLNKPFPTPPWSESSKTKARSTARSPFVRAIARATPNTRTRSKETVINSPWIKCDNSDSDTKKISNEKASSSSETRKGETDAAQKRTAGNSFVRTRAQERMLAFKENLGVEVSFPLLTSF